MQIRAKNHKLKSNILENATGYHFYSELAHFNVNKAKKKHQRNKHAKNMNKKPFWY